MSIQHFVQHYLLGRSRKRLEGASLYILQRSPTKPHSEAVDLGVTEARQIIREPRIGVLQPFLTTLWAGSAQPPIVPVWRQLPFTTGQLLPNAGVVTHGRRPQ